tara:strand:+ start:5356 stop:6006 length:651 start_codon:yes stop_codon:yes gene_type:complete
MPEHEGHFVEEFNNNFAVDLNAELANLWDLVNRAEETVAPQYLNLLNCNSVSTIFRTINTGVPIDANGNFDITQIVTPTLTIEFTQPGPPLILNFNIWPEFTNEDQQAKIQIIEKGVTFWGYSVDGLDVDSADYWQQVVYAQERAAIQLENDLIETMRKGKQGTQAVHSFIPKVGIFLSVPQNTESALVTPGGEVPEGPGGGDFPDEEAMKEAMAQ